MSRRASNNNVSLFPFLAVLVCAMGALILLLLVITRQIRSQQLAAIDAKAAQVEPTDEAMPGPEPPPVPLLPAPASSLEPERTPLVYPVAGPNVVGTIPSNVSDNSRDKSHVERDREALRGYDALLSRRLGQWSATDETLHDQYVRTTTDHNQLASSGKQLDKQARAVRQQTSHSKETEQRLDVQLAALRRAVDEKDREPINAVSKFRIVPFDGISGTVRHPIMIECVEDRFRFLPEGVELTKAELEDFVSSFNPLLSGAAALNAHWAIKDAQTAAVGEPYVLLVVRPSGSLGFYAAKRMLRRLDVPIGYELLGEHQELDLPTPGPEAVRICRVAVQRTLARRGEMKTLRPMAQSLMAQTTGRSGSARRQRSGGSNESSGTRATSRSTDERVESFRRLMEGMRTRNAIRPLGMEQYPDFARRMESQRQPPNRSLSTSVAGNTRGGPTVPGQPANANRPGRSEQTSQRQAATGRSGQRGTAQLRGKTASRSAAANERSDFPIFDEARRHRTNPNGVIQGQPRTARLTPPRLPAPQPAAPSNTPPGNIAPGLASSGSPPHRNNVTANDHVNGRSTAVTDGSTKPLGDNNGAPHGSGGTRNSVAQKPRAGFANLTPSKQQPTLFRRAVSLLVESNSVTVANNPRIHIRQEEVSGPWLGRILTEFEAEVRAWGAAPPGMTWAPEVRFQVGSGAKQTHARVSAALKRLGMRTTDEFTASPTSGSSPRVLKIPQRAQRLDAGGRQ